MRVESGASWEGVESFGGGGKLRPLASIWFAWGPHRERERECEERKECSDPKGCQE